MGGKRPRSSHWAGWSGLIVIAVAAAVLAVLFLRTPGTGDSPAATVPRPASTGLLSSPSTSPTPASPAALVYTVQQGDSLRSIALHFYNDASAWARIYDANKQTIGSPTGILRVGEKLVIP